MLQGLAKAKALKELQALVNSKASLNGLALAKALKRQNELRLDLGMGKSTPANTNPKQEYADTLLFNKSGQILLAQRSAQDDFKPNKWWIVGGKIEQGETPEQGAIRELAEETGVKLSDLKFVEKAKLQNGGVSHRFIGVVDNDTSIHLQKDELQAYRWVNIDELSKFDLLGKLSDLKNLVELAREIVGFDGLNGNDKTADIPQTAYQLADKATPTRRQKDNDTAVALMRQLQADGRKATSDEKAILSRYTGTGGNLVGDDGLKGSDYEYYTPIEVAGSMWDLAKELGFDGGAVLDPSAGTGIFKAAAPTGTLMHSVELSDVSGQINALINDDDTHKVTVSPFEKVANATDDETFDMVITNVPFGTNAARGANKMHDQRYQKDSLEEYFIKRSLDKLKPNKLAMFIVPTKILDGSSYRKFRHSIALRAELLGAYRLPNKVFDKTGADVTTDIIVLKKFDSEIKDKIDSLNDNGGQKLLEQAKVLDKDIIAGKYFTTYGKKFVLGEYQTGKGRYGDVVRVVNDDSLVNILKLVRKFGDSRIDYALLDVQPTAEQSLNNGDVRVLDGQTYEYQNGVWTAKQGGQFDERPFVSIDSFIHHKPTKAQLQAYFAYLMSVGKKADEWLVSLDSNAKNDDELYYYAVLTGVGKALSQTQGVPYAVRYPELTKEMANIANSYHTKRYKAKAYQSLHKAVAVAFDGVGQNGLSEFWYDGQGVQLDDMALDNKQAYEKAVYNGLAENWQVDVAVIQQNNPTFDPLSDDEFCINGDGSKVIAKKDYYVGNYGEFLAKIDDEIAKADDPKIKEKLLKQKAYADTLIDYTDVGAMQFGLMSSIIPTELKHRFFNEFVDSATILVPHDKDDTELLKLDAKDITSVSDTDADPNDSVEMRRFLLNRIFISINNNEKLTISKAQWNDDNEVFTALNNKLTQYFGELNINFNAWLKTQKDYMAQLEYQFNAPENKEFKTIADGTAFEIANFKPKYENFKSLHDYQFEEVRRLSRSFGGICGFDVGLGKAQPLNAKILTPYGWKLMGDIQVGDEVITQDGTTTTVTGVFPQGEKEIFAVKFSDGAMTHCCDEHLWLTQTEKDRKNERYSRSKGVNRVENGTVKALSEIKETLVYQTQKNHKIPMVEPIEFVQKPFALDPYLLGVLLGDGSISGKKVNFCAVDDEIVKRVCDVAQRDFPIYIRTEHHSNRIPQYHFSRNDVNAPNPIRTELKKLGLCEKKSYEKFIPTEYLFGSVQQRIDLLHGLMDTDGYVSKDGITVQYYSTSNQMADDMIALVQSLGGIAWKKEKQGKYKKDSGEVIECKVCYVVSMRMPSHINPFYLSRKKDRVKPKSKYIPIRYITEVTSVGVAQAQCISVEHSSHLYVTDDYIVTHNTATALATIQNMHNIGVKKRTFIIVPNHTISKWAKDIKNVYEDVSDVLVIGTNQNEQDSVSNKHYASDFALLVNSKGKQYRKILMTAEAFGKIPMRQAHIEQYFYKDTGDRRSDKESMDGKIAKVVQKLNGDEQKLPYFEDMSVDSLIMDEAQMFKNGLDGGSDFNRISGLSSKPLDELASRALSARVKSWWVRGQNKANTGQDDGVVLLTATPFTNSPIEIMTMLSLAVGDEKTKKLFGGQAITSVNDFLSVFANIESVLQKDITGQNTTLDMFTGFKNAELLKSVIHQVANIQTAKERGLKIPDEEHTTSNVELSDEDKAMLGKMKLFYRVAKKVEKGDLQGISPELLQEYKAYQAMVKEPDSTIGHAFSLISRMSELTLVGAEMALSRNVIINFDEKQAKIAQKVADEFNNAKKSKNEFKTTRNYPLDDEFITVKTKQDEQGNETYEYAVKARVSVQGNRLVLNVDDATMLANLMELVEKHGLNIKPKLSAKAQALMENVKLELATPKHQGYAKQLIFCDVLSMHQIIKQALINECGIPKSQIAILNAQTMPDGKAGKPDTDDVQDIQDLFANNHYTIVIANKKAETGIDLQKGTQAIHHLTTGWTPDSLDQRNGRGVRQGNMQEFVTIYAYNANGTFDEYKRNLISNKANWIDSLMQKDVEIKGMLTVASGLSEQDYEDLIDADSADKINELIKAKQEREQAEREKRVQAKNTFIYNNMDKARQQAQHTDYVTVFMEQLVQDLNAMIPLVRNNAGGDKAKQKRLEKAKLLMNGYDGLPNDDKLWGMVVKSAEKRANAYGSTISQYDVERLFADEHAIRAELNIIGWSLTPEQERQIKERKQQLIANAFDVENTASKRIKNIISSRLEMMQTTKQAFLYNDDSEYSRDERQAIVDGVAGIYQGKLVYDKTLVSYQNYNDETHFAIANVGVNGVSFLTHTDRNAELVQFEVVKQSERQKAIDYFVAFDFEQARKNDLQKKDYRFSEVLDEARQALYAKIDDEKGNFDNEMLSVFSYRLTHKDSGRAVGDLSKVWSCFVPDAQLTKVQQAYYAPMIEILGGNIPNTVNIELKRKDVALFDTDFVLESRFYTEHLLPFLLANGLTLNAEYDNADKLSDVAKKIFWYDWSVREVLGIENRKFTSSKEYDELVQKLAQVKFGGIVGNLDELLSDGLESVFTAKEIGVIKQVLGERSDIDPDIAKNKAFMERAKALSVENNNGVEVIGLYDNGSTLYHRKEQLKEIIGQDDKGKNRYEWHKSQSVWVVPVAMLEKLTSQTWWDFDRITPKTPTKYA